MNQNSPITSCREHIKNFLKSRKELNYVDIRETFERKNIELPLKKPLITISKGKPSVNTISFSNYLSERFDEIENKIVELQGKELTIAYDLHIWNSTSPKLGGERQIEIIQEQLQSIFEFESNAIEGITFFSFIEGTAIEDPEEDLFHCRCTLTIKILWKKEIIYDVIDEIATFANIKEG